MIDEEKSPGKLVLCILVAFVWWIIVAIFIIADGGR